MIVLTRASSNLFNRPIIFKGLKPILYALLLWYIQQIGPIVSYLIHYSSGGQLNTSRGPNLTYRTPSRARSSVSFRRAAREYCPPPQTESVTNREKTTAFKPTCLNFTLHQWLLCRYWNFHQSNQTCDLAGAGVNQAAGRIRPAGRQLAIAALQQ
jgi:hypothetical protein